jgi:putative transposase
LQCVPRVIVTDKLRSYGVAQRRLLPGVEHRQSRYLNNRAENSHRPTRRRERQMQRFKSSDQAQRFLSAHAFIYGHFHPRRHQMPVACYRTIRCEAQRLAPGGVCPIRDVTAQYCRPAPNADRSKLRLQCHCQG